MIVTTGFQSFAQLHPAEAYPDIFHAVQMAEFFDDSKTFADARPRVAVQAIRKSWQAQNPGNREEIQAFVEKYFVMPEPLPTPEPMAQKATVHEHIEALWPVLTRQDTGQAELSTRLALPNPYVVPGGRFREIYYWDSYFTMLGLQQAGHEERMADMVANFAWMLTTYGHIPNGNRTYFLSRSQPPFFALMVDLLAKVTQDSAYVTMLPALRTEYDFWMDGQDKLNAEKPAYRRVVQLSGGEVLNRYWDAEPKPRPESYREDVHLAQAANREPEELYRDLRAACESGWDFSSRWLADGRTLESIITTQVLPVDLNSLLFHLEKTLAKAYLLAGQSAAADTFRQAAHKRQQAIQTYFYDKEKGFFTDYQWETQQQVPRWSLAGIFPLYFGLAEHAQAARVANNLSRHFLFTGGLMTTLTFTHQQWDAPNGWAPLHWISIQALERYGHSALAQEIARRWLATNERVYKNTGKLMEKYHVLCENLKDGGGEYPTQDGFGWTNGVYLKLDALYGRQTKE